MIRFAEEKDIYRIVELLTQVHKVHSDKRPDIFKINARKYEADDVRDLLKDEAIRIFCYEDEQAKVQGYAFCRIIETKNSKSMCDLKKLYIDDICVDEMHRRQGIGKALYDEVRRFAKEIGCYHIVLNVWELNTEAKSFYASLGMKVLSSNMEDIL